MFISGISYKDQIGGCSQSHGVNGAVGAQSNPPPILSRCTPSLTQTRR